MRALSDVSLDLLRVFERVVRTGSMTAAARTLFITQPAVSHAVSQLEQLLDCRLFERASRRLFLTDEGRAVYEAASRAREAIAQGERALQEVRARKTGLLRIGCSFLILQTCLTPLLAAFHKKHPDVRLQVEIENRMQPMLELVRGRKVDLLFLATPEPGAVAPDLDSETLGRFQYAFFASRAHYPQLDRRRLSLEEINAHPIVILRPGNNTRDYLDRLFADAGLKLNAQWETKTMALTEEFTKAGLGIGAMLVSEHPIVRPHTEGLMKLRCSAALPQGRYMAFHRRDEALADTARIFLDMVHQHLEAMPSRRSRPGKSAPA